MGPAPVLALLLAHHDTAVGRVGGPDLQSAGGVELAMPLPRAEMGLQAGWTDFSRVLRDGQAMDSAQVQVLVQTLTPTLGLRLPRRTAVHVALPLGRVVGEESTLGLGDLQLSVGQALGRKHPRWSFYASAGLRSPTGHYNQDAALSVTDIRDEDGEYMLTTYDTRASLGSGAFALSAAGWGRATLGPVTWLVSASFQQPVAYTPDDIFWGRDLSVQTGPVLALGRKDKLQLSALATGSAHSQDRLHVLDEATGKPVLRQVGARQELGVSASASLRVRKNVACGLSTEVPVYQNGQGVQLMRRYSLSGSCSVGLGLGQKG